jgi:hypothetical protein
LAETPECVHDERQATITRVRDLSRNILSGEAAWVYLRNGSNQGLSFNHGMDTGCPVLGLRAGTKCFGTKCFNTAKN